MSKELTKDQIDVAHVFLVYMAHLGDAVATAVECQLLPAKVEELATSEKWDNKLKHLIDMSRTGKPGDWEKAQNRALNLVQCVRLRRIIERMLDHYESKKGEDLFVVGTSESYNANGTTKNVRTVSAKIPADLSAAMEKVQHLTYLALGDSLGERKDLLASDPAKSEQTAANMHKALVALLNKSEAISPPKTQELLTPEYLPPLALK